MKVHLNNIDIHYTVDGDKGPWVTLSHSLGCNLTSWDAQAALLSKHYRVLRYDSRGHGQTSAPTGAYTLDEMAEDVHQLLTHLGITQTHWIGISMGGMIGQTYALAHPGVFQSMLLADSTSRRPPQAAAMWGERIRTARAEGMQGVLESTLTRWFTEGYRARAPAAREAPAGADAERIGHEPAQVVGLHRGLSTGTCPRSGSGSNVGRALAPA